MDRKRPAPTAGTEGAGLLGIRPAKPPDRERRDSISSRTRNIREHCAFWA
ncbi:MAG TPA: hypothetical protein VNK49_05570 [Anaerolineales bacterium]|nr:hypothetical protein [Anaerolineales bacterium]